MKFWDLKKDAHALYIYGDIEAVQMWGDEVTPDTLRRELDGVTGPLDVYINSGGGDVFAGMAIYNIIKRHADDVTVYIDGLAASIASVIAMAGDKIIMPENALLMIHNAWTMAIGNARDMRQTAEELDRVDSLIRDIYTARTGQDAESVTSAMEAETWYTAAEALEAGMIDEVEANKAIAASLTGSVLTIGGEKIDCSRYRHADRLRNAVERVEIVYGPPCSGKSTYVRERAGADDLIYDYDALVDAMTNQGGRGTEKTVAHDIAVAVRRVMIDDMQGENRAKAAYIITSWPGDALREQLDGLAMTDHRMDASREECIARLEADGTRTDKDGWKAVIDRWFEEHDEPDDGGESQPVKDTALDDQRKQFTALRRKIIETV